ncbi:thymidylate kinase [Chloroflexota bacterium]|nr:thymidylate kinase [Anaerolineaceae bacterium]QRN82889.1 thymidylate kinase [Chloroflexota bacterium]
MSKPNFYGAGFPYREIVDLPGKLIVLEGSDGVGRSTQTQLLRHWLEDEGFAVSDTGLRRSGLTQKGLDEAKNGHTLSRITMSLFYATDFADRLENQIIPALEAGFVVLSDRYFYSIMARDIVRGADPEWARKVYGFALKPDLILYLKADITDLVSRLIHGRGLNYWEAGMDIHLADNLFDSFVDYQSKIGMQFSQLAKEYKFVTIDAGRPVSDVFSDLQSHIRNLLEDQHPIIDIDL